MDWDRVDSTLRKIYRKNGKTFVTPQSRTPLDELIAQEPLPDLAAMTDEQLREHAHAFDIALAKDLDRSETIEMITDALDLNWHERLKGMRATLDYIFADGPHPLAINRRCYSIVKAIRPGLINGMSCADLAVLCDDGKGRTCDGRATVSARTKRLYETPIRKAGMHGYKAPFQKDEDASRAYSGSAQGNQNRRGRAFLELNGHKKKKAA